MIKKIAALSIIGALAFAPVLSYAEDAAPAPASTAKPMPKKSTTHKSTHKTSHKKSTKPMAKPMASETPKS
jgi:hypothetical protein